jgi:hypothetical protein
VTNNTSRKEDSLDDVDVTEADFERIISLPQMQPSDDEEDEESENGEDEKNEDVHSENEQEKNDPQQEAEDEVTHSLSYKQNFNFSFRNETDFPLHFSETKGGKKNVRTTRQRR